MFSFLHNVFHLFRNKYNHLKIVYVNSVTMDRSKIFLFGKVFNLFNSLPNDKILDWSKLKGFADDKLDMDINMKFAFWSLETFCVKKKMLVTSIFFPHNVSKGCLLRVIKTQNCVVKSKNIIHITDIVAICTYRCFSWILINSASQNMVFTQMTAFPQEHH